MLTNAQGHEPANRQIGITERPQEHLLLAALRFIGPYVASRRLALEDLRGIVRAELENELADVSTETGELGYTTQYGDGRLSVTVGFSTTAYEALEVPVENRPRDLQPIPADVQDVSGGGQGAEIAGEGDVVLKVASNDVYVTEHVLRRIEHELADRFTVVWAQTGVQRYSTQQAKNPRRESRALNGFLDGTSNLDPSNPDDRGLIFTDHERTDYPPLPTPDQYGSGVTFPSDLRPPPTQPEPAELNGGSYMAIEILAALGR